MKNRDVFISLVTLLLFAPLTAYAQSGINLAWDDCGTFGHELKAFACDTNAGNDLLFVSAAAPVDMPQLLGAEIEVIVALSNNTPITPWWHMEPAGCHANGVAGVFDFTTGPSSCLDVWQGQAAGGVNWISGYSGQPSWAQLRAAVAIPGTVALPANTEAYLFAFQVKHLKTVGAGSCAGCNVPACLTLTTVKLVQPIGVGDYTITTPLDRQSASWVCPGTFYFGGPPFEPSGCLSNCPVPTRKSSWGTIKSLYR